MTTDGANHDDSNILPSSNTGFLRSYVAIELAYMTAACLIYYVLGLLWMFFVGGRSEIFMIFTILSVVVFIAYCREQDAQCSRKLQ